MRTQSQTDKAIQSGNIVRFEFGNLPPRVYSKSGKPVLLPTSGKAEMLLMLLRASDKKPSRWKQGFNDNGWHFIYSI